jgi:hypothetical protein
MEVPRRQTTAHLGQPEDDFIVSVCTPDFGGQNMLTVSAELIPTVLQRLRP